MRLVLIDPKAVGLAEVHKRYRYVPVRAKPDPVLSLGMLSLCANIKGHEVIYIDNQKKRMSTRKLFDHVLSLHPDLVGFGGTMVGWPEAARLSEELAWKGVLTVYGGPNATVRPEKHVKYFNYVLRGAAEHSLSVLLGCIQRCEVTLPKIPGICVRPKYISDAADVNLDELELPARAQIDMSSYRRQAIGFKMAAPMDVVHSTRGCPYSCKFCSSQFIWNRRYMKASAERVLAEVTLLKQQYGTRSINFREDNFTVDKARLEAICRGLGDMGMEWDCQSRADAIDEPTVSMMKRCGCKMISCGFESASDDTLERMNKGFSFDVIQKAIDIFERTGMLWSGNFIVGVPGDTESDVIKTVRYVKKLRKKKHALLARHPYRFVGIPVSEFYNTIISEELVEYGWKDGELLIAGTGALTAKQVEELIDRYR